MSPVPPSFPDSNAVFTQIMEQKSGSIFIDEESTSDERTKEETQESGYLQKIINQLLVQVFPMI